MPCVATLDGAQAFDLVRDGAAGVTKGKVAWIGRAADVPAGGEGKTWNIGGKVPTPGLVDPPTHIVYGEEGPVDFDCCRQHALGSRGSRPRCFQAVPSRRRPCR